MCWQEDALGNLKWMKYPIAIRASEGSQMKKNSFNSTAIPHSEKNARIESGETSIGRKGRKYRFSLKGARNATPRPPFVMASSKP